MSVRTISSAVLIFVLLTCAWPQSSAPATAVIRYTPPTALPDTGHEGSRWTGSIAAPYRPDAWRCMEGNAIHDPCFSLRDKQAVVCGANPPSKAEGFRLALTKPLPLPDVHSAPSNEPWAWLVELNDGMSCAPFTGTLPVIAGQALVYVVRPRLIEKRASLIGILSVTAICLVLIGVYVAHRLGSPLYLKLAYVPVNLCLGTVFCASVAINKPLTMYLTPPGKERPASREEREDIRRSAGRLRGHKIVAMYWGVGLLLIAAKEVIFAFLLSVDTFVLVNTPTSYCLIGLLVVGTPILVKRLKQQASAAEQWPKPNEKTS